MPAVVECDGLGNAADRATWLASNGGATASDSCSAITWSNSQATSPVTTGCGLTTRQLVTFTVTNDCDLMATSSAIFSTQVSFI